MSKQHAILILISKQFNGIFIISLSNGDKLKTRGLIYFDLKYVNCHFNPLYNRKLNVFQFRKNVRKFHHFQKRIYYCEMNHIKETSFNYR